MVNVLGPFLPLCNHDIFIKLKLPIPLVLARQREKSQKYFNRSAINKNLNDSNLCSTLGAMNCPNWELFSGSSGRYVQLLAKPHGVQKNTILKPGGALHIAWVRGRAIGKGIDLPDIGIRSAIDLHNLL